MAHTARESMQRGDRGNDDLAAVLEASLEAVVGMDAEGRISEWNSTAESTFGWTRQEAVGRTVANTIIPERFRAAHTAALRRFRETGVSHILGRRVSISALHRSGREFPVELRIAPLRSGSTRFLAFISDLSALRTLEAERHANVASIEAQRRLLETILNHAPAAIALISREQVVQFANPAFRELSPGRAMIGRHAKEVWPEVADEVHSPLHHVLQTGEPHHGVDVLVPLREGDDGPLRDRWFTFSLVPTQTIGDEVDAVLVVAIETTEQVLARKQVGELAELARRRATELRGIIDHMTEAVFVADAQGHVTLINTAGAALVGLSTSTTLTIADLALRLLPKGGRGTSSTADLPLALALRGEPVVLGDTVISGGDGEPRLLRSTASPIRDANGAILGAVQVARDLTEVERLDRLKGEFVRAAAHALNTPIAVVKGCAQIIARNISTVPEPGREMMQAMQRGVDRMQSIVRDLTYVSSIELDTLQLSRAPIRLDQAVARVVSRTTRFRSGVTVRTVRLDPVTIEVDREGLEQTLFNLISNATRYSKHQGVVDVSVTAEGQEAMVSVRDYGAGIPLARQQHIFERFFRAHADTPFDFEGLGIGLYISREIVTRQGGRMWFESVEGKGSVFHVAYPIAGAAS